MQWCPSVGTTFHSSRTVESETGTTVRCSRVMSVYGDHCFALAKKISFSSCLFKLFMWSSFFVIFFLLLHLCWWMGVGNDRLVKIWQTWPANCHPKDEKLIIKPCSTERNVSCSVNSLIICKDSDWFELLLSFVHMTLVLLREAVARKVREETRQLRLES